MLGFINIWREMDMTMQTFLTFGAHHVVPVSSTQLTTLQSSISHLTLCPGNLDLKLAVRRNTPPTLFTVHGIFSALLRIALTAFKVAGQRVLRTLKSHEILFSGLGSMIPQVIEEYWGSLPSQRYAHPVWRCGHISGVHIISSRWKQGLAYARIRGPDPQACKALNPYT